MTDECKQEFTLRISRANSTQLVVILYEMVLIYLDECEENKNLGKESFSQAIRKARGCLNELLASINYNYEPSLNLRKLLFFCIRRLANAEVTFSVEPLNDIRKVIIPLKEAYSEIASLNQNGPVMENSQELYIGLTYGKNTLTENLADQSLNRGMLV